MVPETDRTAALSGAPDAQTRRRGETLEHAIFDAVLDQLCSVGYPGLTMEGIAACAHTGKAALYRRWERKEDLIVDALEHMLPSLSDLPDHGNLRDDLLEVLRRLTTLINSPTGGALKCLLAESDREHPFVKLVHERVLMPRKRMFDAVLQRAVDRGEARPDAVESLAAEVGPAMVAQRFLAEGPPVPDSYLVSVVDDVVMPLVRA
ncbi:MAG TPA: TetR/AcrR family transcriptional regulator [Actinomycetota bacterium]|nr:TetR/AcrR family transcriptional regulator [Actinomycetota bacterium]